MPTIQLTDQAGFDIDANVAPGSALLRYFRSLPSMVFEGGNLANMQGLTLDQPLVSKLKSGLTLKQNVALGNGMPALMIQAGTHGSFEVIARKPDAAQLFDPDLYGDGIEIPEGACFVGVRLEASATAGATVKEGEAGFGIEGGGSVEFANYRNFAVNGGTTLAGALQQTIGGFVIPARASDLSEIPVGGIATVTGHGLLKVSVSAELLATANPLLTVPLPGPLPTPSIKAGGSVAVAASYEMRGEYQMRVRVLAGGIVRVGWYRSKATELSVNVTASEGLAGGFGDTDLFGTVLGAISSDPTADRRELAAAGVSDQQADGIRSAVAAAVQRRLELAISTGIRSLHEGDAAFLYDIDVAALSPESSRAIDEALAGDLTGLHSKAPLAAVTCVHSIVGTLRSDSLTLKVNLLGIYNFISIGKLVSAGTILHEPVTGSLVITDENTATRLRAGLLNFGADPDKVRRVLAETFLITAVYRGSNQGVASIALSSSHTFFSLEDHTSRAHMRQFVQAAEALGLLSDAEAALPAGVQDFGRSMIDAETRYDDALTERLFVDEFNRPFPVAFYERAGREALQLLVREDAPDAQRRGPAIDDDQWARMKDRGQFNFGPLFPGVRAPVLGAIVSDYTAIVWWAGAMAGAAQIISALNDLLRATPKPAADQPALVKLRKQLADHLGEVSKDTAEEFGQPWGLVAMNQVANRRAEASIVISSPKLSITRTRSLAAGV